MHAIIQATTFNLKFSKKIKPAKHSNPYKHVREHVCVCDKATLKTFDCVYGGDECKNARIRAQVRADVRDVLR